MPFNVLVACLAQSAAILENNYMWIQEANLTANFFLRCSGVQQLFFTGVTKEVDEGKTVFAFDVPKDQNAAVEQCVVTSGETEFKILVSRHSKIKLLQTITDKTHLFLQLDPKVQASNVVAECAWNTSWQSGKNKILYVCDNKVFQAGKNYKELICQVQQIGNNSQLSEFKISECDIKGLNDFSGKVAVQVLDNRVLTLLKTHWYRELAMVLNVAVLLRIFWKQLVRYLTLRYDNKIALERTWPHITFWRILLFAVTSAVNPLQSFITLASFVCLILVSRALNIRFIRELVGKRREVQTSHAKPKREEHTPSSHDLDQFPSVLHFEE